MGISYGNYEPTERKKREVVYNGTFVGCIQFYRSKEHADGNYGTKDVSYKGLFGFDKFDKNVCADALIKEYQDLKTVIPDDAVISSVKKYLCAYLSIWPPNVEGNLDNSKSKVTLYVKAEEASTKLGKMGDIEFVSSDPNIIINGSPIINLTLKGDAKPLIIECKGTFDKDVYIEARVKGESQILGKLIIKANAVQYKTVIQPVLVDFTPTTSFVKDTQVSSLPFNFQVFMDYLNKESFNQSYILAEKPVIAKRFGVVKNELIADKFISQYPDDKKFYLAAQEDVRSTFNTKIEKLYTASQGGNSVEEMHKEKVQALKDSGVSEAIEKYITKFNSEYNYTQINSSEIEKIKKLHAKKVVTDVCLQKKIEELYNDYVIKKKEFDRIVAEKGITSGAPKMNKVGTVHVFIYSDIEGAFNGLVPGVAAYSETKSGIVHVFKSTTDHTEVNGLIAHEIGHSLGLSHTFEKKVINGKEQYSEYVNDNTKDSKQYLERKKAYYLKDLNATKELLKKDNESVTDNQEISNLNYSYYSLKEMLKKPSNYTQDPDAFQEELISFISEIKLEESTEISTVLKASSDILKQKKIRLEQEISDIDRDLKSAERARELSRYKRQSDTLENFMDYFLDPSKEDSKPREGFKFKSFNQSQWKEMQKVGLENKFLK